ncbi:hypothetical protein DBR28_15800 [Chryseobacterium sp. HMWF028]|nr:hypothetical protein DBR28_15800 [Chryseobacterium sp. HMWF028]
MLLASVTYSQVEINTTAPTQALDVNGNGRFRLVPDIQKDALFYKLVLMLSETSQKKLQYLL